MQLLAFYITIINSQSQGRTHKNKDNVGRGMEWKIPNLAQSLGGMNGVKTFLLSI